MSLTHIIYDKFLRMPYRFVEWLSIEELDTDCLCGNPKAIDFIQRNADMYLMAANKKDFMVNLCTNPNDECLDLIERYFLHCMDEECWRVLIMNADVNWVPLLERHIKREDIKRFPEICQFDFAYDFLLKNMPIFFYKQSIPFVCMNSACEHIIEMYIHHNMLDEDSWLNVCMNPACVGMIRDNLNRLRNMNTRHMFWEYIAMNTNPKAIQLIRENMSEFDHEDNWLSLCSNPCPKAIDLVIEYIDRLDGFCMEMLCTNPSALRAINILASKHSPSLECLGNNPNPECKKILSLNMHRILQKNNWDFICHNQYMIEHIKDNKDRLRKRDYKCLSRNPKIFEIDRPKYQKNIEMVSNVMNIVLET